MKRAHVAFALALLALAVLTSCKPDKIEIELYTSDLEAAFAGEIIEVPVTIVFEGIGDDAEENVGKATELARKYFPEESQFDLQKGEYDSVLTITGTIPMGTKEKIDSYIETTPRLFAVVLQGSTVLPGKTALIKAMNEELEQAEIDITLEPPAKSTVIKLVGDSAKTPEVSAIAVFVNKKAELLFKKKIARRQTIPLEFKGGEDSVYSTVPIQFTIQF